ncbi:hypothetical protein FGF1_02650 [Flavobacteriaceae bacterium GF1]
MPGAWGPTIAAILLSYRETGKRGVGELLKKIRITKVPLKYYLFALFVFLALGCISLGLYTIFNGQLPNMSVVLEGMGLGNDQIILAIVLSPVFFLINTLIGGPIAEEFGWRGFAQPGLQKKFSPLKTGLIIGLVWSLWHLPLFVFLPKAVGQMPIFAYIPLMTGVGVIFSWLYNRTKGSMFLAILLHGGLNFAHGFLGADLIKGNNLLLGIQVLLVIGLAIILAATKSMNQ